MIKDVIIFDEIPEGKSPLEKIVEGRPMPCSKELNRPVDFFDEADMKNDSLPSLDEMNRAIENGREISLDELRESRPDVAEYIDKLKERLGDNEYADSIKIYKCENGDIILKGTDNRPFQESNYAVIRGRDIYCAAGNAKGDGHLNEFANNATYIPGCRYHFENVIYEINEKGQVTKTHEHHVTERHTDRNEERGNLKAVADAKGGQSNDVGGHIVAHNIDGPTEAINILPMDSDFNNGKDWKSMENELLQAYQDGGDFEVDRQITYDETGRPCQIEITATINGEMKHWTFDLPS